MVRFSLTKEVFIATLPFIGVNFNALLSKFVIALENRSSSTKIVVFKVLLLNVNSIFF